MPISSSVFIVVTERNNLNTDSSPNAHALLFLLVPGLAPLFTGAAAVSIIVVVVVVPTTAIGGQESVNVVGAPE
jgi:hypothetical protein